MLVHRAHRNAKHLGDFCGLQLFQLDQHKHRPGPHAKIIESSVDLRQLLLNYQYALEGVLGTFLLKFLTPLSRDTVCLNPPPPIAQAIDSSAEDIAFGLLGSFPIRMRQGTYQNVLREILSINRVACLALEK